MRKTRIVLLHIERDQFLNGPDVVQRVQVQPLVFQHAPPGFDQRIGEADLSLRQNAFEKSRFDQLIDGPVVILNTAVGQQQGLTAVNSLGGREQDFRGNTRVKCPGDSTPGSAGRSCR